MAELVGEEGLVVINLSNQATPHIQAGQTAADTGQRVIVPPVRRHSLCEGMFSCFGRFKSSSRRAKVTPLPHPPLDKEKPTPLPAVLPGRPMSIERIIEEHQSESLSDQDYTIREKDGSQEELKDLRDRKSHDPVQPEDNTQPNFMGYIILDERKFGIVSLPNTVTQPPDQPSGLRKLELPPPSITGDIPTDRDRPAVQSHTAGHHEVLEPQVLSRSASNIIRRSSEKMTSSEVSIETLHCSSQTESIVNKEEKNVRLDREILSDEEIEQLKGSSIINDIEYEPWNPNDTAAHNELSSSPSGGSDSLFYDPDGKVTLNRSQEKHLRRWVRPNDICIQPKMAEHISSLTIKQSMIGNCTFVAALVTGADYEDRIKKRLVTSCLYPHDSSGKPIINKNGKYLISLFLNGCWRKVVIDDLLPIDRHDLLLCSYSGMTDEFWVSLIEKGYMKVMGGYDCHAINPLHALTGWIPENVTLDKCNKEKTFQMMVENVYNGNALLTLGTSSQLSKHEAEAVGLVRNHAYAVLQVVHVLDQEMLQIKNPWRERLENEGDYSRYDGITWTPELKAALNYDPNKIDIGVFWMDWKAVCRYFKTLYAIWNPSLFEFKQTIHDSWKKQFEKERSIRNNPQYSLHVSCTESQPATVWILLSRHITGEDDANGRNEKFISMDVVSSHGQKLYTEPNEFAYRSNTLTPKLHFLAKLKVVGNQSYTVIPSLQDDSPLAMATNYTIKVYSTCPIQFTPVPTLYQHSKKVAVKRDKFIGNRKGGKVSVEFTLTLSCATSNILLEATGPKDSCIWINIEMAGFGMGFSKHMNVARACGYSALEASNVPEDEYTITVSMKDSVLQGYHSTLILTATVDNGDFTLKQKH